MPDLDILIEISDYYNVDLTEILNGERKSEIMDKETKETVLQAVEYTNTETHKNNKKVRFCLTGSILLNAASVLLRDSSLYLDNTYAAFAIDFIQGVAIGIIIMSVIMLSRYGARIRAFKQRVKSKLSN